MLSRTKSNAFVVAVITVFFIIGWLIGSPAADIVTQQPGGQPAPVVEPNIPAKADRTVVASQSSLSERLYQASLNWADYAEVSQPATTIEQPAPGEAIRQASLNWADFVTIEDFEMGQSSMLESIRRASLNYADYVEIANELPQPTMEDKMRQASLNWADYVEATEPAYILPEPVEGVSSPY
jgi:hypothetical protein